MTIVAEKISPADTITAAIIARLEQGVRPWIRPWRAGVSGGRGEAYRGMNTFWLWMAAEQAGFGSRTWMTYRQAVRRVSRMKGVVSMT